MRNSGPKIAAAFLVAASLIAAGAMAASSSAKAATPPDTKSRLVYWSDGDSGRLPDGRKFRLHGVDAPETGSLNQRGGAKCESERALGYTAKASAVEATRGKTIEVMKEYGNDRYGRIVVDLDADGEDVAALLIISGTHQAWNYDARKPKPDWCAPPVQKISALRSF